MRRTLPGGGDRLCRKNPVGALADKLSPCSKADRTSQNSCVIVPGYLAGAAWHGAFAYESWVTWIASTDWFFFVSLIFLSDPDELALRYLDARRAWIVSHNPHAPNPARISSAGAITNHLRRAPFTRRTADIGKKRRSSLTG